LADRCANSGRRDRRASHAEAALYYWPNYDPGYYYRPEPIVPQQRQKPRHRQAKKIAGMRDAGDDTSCETGSREIRWRRRASGSWLSTHDRDDHDGPCAFRASFSGARIFFA